VVQKEWLETITSELEKFITTKTVVGEPIDVGGVTLVPVQTVSFGFGSGGGEGKSEKDTGTGGGGGAGARLRPIAIVAVKDGDVQVYNLGSKGVMEKLAEMVPQVLAKVKSKKVKKEEKNSSEG